MAKFNFLDDIGLRNLVDNIIENFSTKSQTEGIRKTLSDRIEEVYQYLLTALGEEISRAELSEAELMSLIEQEVSRATDYELDLKRNLSDEISRATGRENAIEVSLSKEIERAMGEETLLRDSLDSEIERAKSYEEEIKTSLEEETSRALDSETLIRESLEEEISRAKASEENIKTSLDNEARRAIQAEQTLDSSIDEVSVKLNEEISRASESESQLALDLSSLGEELRNKDLETEQTLSSLNENIENTKVNFSSQIGELSNRTDILEEKIADGAGAVKDVLVDGVSIVKDRIAYLQKSEISGESPASILTYPDTSYFPTEESEVPPNFTTLYLALDTKILYKWDGASYSELGKNNIVVTDALPEIGVEDILYVLSTDYTVYQWVGDSYKEIGGKDEDLRNQFIIHTSSLNPHNITKEKIGLSYVDNTSDLDKPISIATQEALDSLNSSLTGISVSLEEGLSKASEELRTHVRNKENPHNVTAEILGLGLVDNTRDLEKPISYAVQAELDNKVNYEDIKDSLVSTETAKPLSARQGSVLNGKISELSGTILSIGSVFQFKGTLSSVEDLETVENPVQGDAWQVRVLDETGKDTSGVVYAYTDDNGWVEISASVSDISAYVASTEDVYAIIDAF
jgi:hypothetical protein